MATDEQLDERYLTWLYNLVGLASTRKGSSSHWSLMSQLYQKEFRWFVHNDDNRVVDGIDLRYEFLDKEHESPDPGWLDLECSVLEMLIALARRASYEVPWTPGRWFWQMIKNLQLWHFTDANYSDEKKMEVNEVLDRLIERTYDKDGTGGLFPLQFPTEDQREVELWYQLAAYILEADIVGASPS